MSKKLIVALVALLVFTGGAGAEINRDLSSDLANSLTHTGSSLPAALAGGMMFLGNERQERAGRQAADALVVTGMATQLLKNMFPRGRPCEPGALDGFPSGHASTTFAFARAISEEYDDWGKVAYLWAGGVSWSRVRRDDHTTGQVLVGAALGWYLADQSIRSRAGLCGGLIVRETPGYLGQETATGTADPVVPVWSTTW